MNRFWVRALLVAGVAMAVPAMLPAQNVQPPPKAKLKPPPKAPPQERQLDLEEQITPGQVQRGTEPPPPKAAPPKPVAKPAAPPQPARSVGCTGTFGKTTDH